MESRNAFLVEAEPRLFHQRPPGLLHSSLRFEIFKRSLFPGFFFSSLRSRWITGSYTNSPSFFSSPRLFPLTTNDIRRIHRSESRRRKSSNERPSRVTRSKSGQTSLSVRNDSNIGKEIIIRTRLLFVLDTPFVRFFPAFLFLFFSYISRKVARDARQCSLRNSIYSEIRAISSRNR